MVDKKIGILITNVGTPDAPEEDAVRQYLREFLADPHVIDYPRWFWLPILHGIILRTRPPRSAQLYQKIWTPKGSPLLLTMRSIAGRLETELNQEPENEYHVEIGMRYGNPFLRSGLGNLLARGMEEIIVFPLYPQYSVTTTGSTFHEINKLLEGQKYVPPIRRVSGYFQHPDYIDSIAKSIEQHWSEHGKSERLLFSFHGVPKRYQKLDDYREHCLASANLVIDRLHLDTQEWKVAFQSRFGPEPWLQPYTDQILERWGREGTNDVAVIAPGFSVDCLETIDELGREGKDIYQEAGGNRFRYIPALNDSESHIRLMKNLILGSPS